MLQSKLWSYTGEDYRRQIQTGAAPAPGSVSQYIYMLHVQVCGNLCMHSVGCDCSHLGDYAAVPSEAVRQLCDSVKLSVSAHINCVRLGLLSGIKQSASWGF